MTETREWMQHLDERIVYPITIKDRQIDRRWFKKMLKQN